MGNPICGKKIDISWGFSIETCVLYDATPFVSVYVAVNGKIIWYCNESESFGQAQNKAYLLADAYKKRGYETCVRIDTSGKRP